ncbi:Uncharacterised protein [Mycobacteroides abscessus subsp. abscessus]|nr:Uncharacterised protein [Mycobacteroides abscessus subsp. abscessus]
MPLASLPILDTGLAGSPTAPTSRWLASGSSVEEGRITASGYCLRSACTAPSAEGSSWNNRSGPARKSRIARFWMATVEYSRQSRCFRVALTVLTIMPRPSPGRCSAATTRRLRRWK